ncbi:hypothetical protein DLREEDagrD3_22250 [Denitratisoma sp. agr-D3]
MAKLILSMDGLTLKEIPLVKERVTIGRKPHNDIQIDNLAISGEHAAIVTILNDSFLEDLASTNGTYVNGKQIQKHFLQPNDVIELGKYRLKYINDVPVQQTQDFEKTMVLRPDMMRASVANAPSLMPSAATRTSEEADVPGGGVPPMGQRPPVEVSAATSQDQAMPLGVIQVLSGGAHGRELALVKPLTTLGKTGLQVAAITRQPLGYFITHVEGTTFPIVNGTMLDTKAHPLQDRDVIELAGVKMAFFLKRA